KGARPIRAGGLVRQRGQQDGQERGVVVVTLANGGEVVGVLSGSHGPGGAEVDVEVGLPLLQEGRAEFHQHAESQDEEEKDNQASFLASGKPCQGRKGERLHDSSLKGPRLPCVRPTPRALPAYVFQATAPAFRSRSPRWACCPHRSGRQSNTPPTEARGQPQRSQSGEYQ